MFFGKLKCQRNYKRRFSWLCRLALMVGLLIALNACTSGEAVPNTPSSLDSTDSEIVVSTTAVSVNTSVPTLTSQGVTMPSQTPSPTITATPAATPIAPSYIIEPEGQYENWHKYTNLIYGFSFSFPSDWNVYTRDHLVQVRQGDLGLIIGIKWPGDEASIQRTGVGAGELMQEGTVNFLGQELTRSVLVFRGYDKTVLYSVAAELEVDGRVFTLSLDYFDDPATVLNDEVQEIADKIVESFALVEPALISESQDTDLTNLPAPQAGWAWYYNELHDFTVTYPESWRQSGATFDAPETNSQIQVRPHDLPTGEDWLDWVRGNQADLIFTDPVASDVIEANATVDGQPAYFRLAEGGGASQILLVFPEGDQLVIFYFHSGTLPRVEAEMQVFRTMIENFVWHGRPNSQTTLPQGWETGGSLEIFLPAITPAELANEALQPFRDGLTGTATKWDWPDFVLTTDEGQTYNIQLSSGYDFQGLPVQGNNKSETEAIAEGDQILVTGYPLAVGDSIRPYTIAVERAGNWQQVYYQAFFDLTRRELDPDLLALYPSGEDFAIGLRGSVTQVIPLLADEAGNSLAAEALALDSNQEVFARGTLQNTEPFRITLAELFVLDGECVVVSQQEENCFFWQPIFP